MNRFRLAVLVMTASLAFAGMRAQSQIIIDDFSSANQYGPPGFSGSFSFGSNTGNDDYHLFDDSGAGVPGPVRHSFVAIALATGSAGSANVGYSTNISGGNFNYLLTATTFGAVVGQFVGVTGYGVMTEHDNINVGLGPTASITTSFGPSGSLDLDYSHISAFHLNFASFSGTPNSFVVALADDAFHTLTLTQALTSPGAQSLDFIKSSFLAGTADSQFGVSAVGAFDWGHVSELAWRFDGSPNSNWQLDSFTASTTSSITPEGSSFAMMALGLTGPGLIILRRRVRK